MPRACRICASTKCPIRHFAMTGIVTDSMIERTSVGSDIRATPPSLRISAGTRSRAITAHAPASWAIRACSGVTTSMITPPFSIWARPALTLNEPFMPREIGGCALISRGPLFTAPFPLRDSLRSATIRFYAGVRRPPPRLESSGGHAGTLGTRVGMGGDPAGVHRHRGGHGPPPPAGGAPKRGLDRHPLNLDEPCRRLHRARLRRLPGGGRLRDRI